MAAEAMGLPKPQQFKNGKLFTKKYKYVPDLNSTPEER